MTSVRKFSIPARGSFRRSMFVLMAIAVSAAVGSITGFALPAHADSLGQVEVTSVSEISPASVTKWAAIQNGGSAYGPSDTAQIAVESSLPDSKLSTDKRQQLAEAGPGVRELLIIATAGFMLGAVALFSGRKKRLLGPRYFRS